VEGGTVAPGLGEAFLDAGCRTVVQTLWELDDEMSLRFSRRFLAAVGDWSDPWDLAAALRHARREQRRLAGDDPFHWGPYQVVTTSY
jgi:CHAT domain-containing protein